MCETRKIDNIKQTFKKKKKNKRTHHTYVHDSWKFLDKILFKKENIHSVGVDNSLHCL